MTQFIMTSPVFREFDDDGSPLAGGKAYFYEAGTNNLKDVYTTSAGSTAHTSPVTLDSRGEAVIYGSGAYKVTIKDADGVVIRTVDNYKIFPISAFAETILDDADAAAARATLELGTAAVLDAGANPNNVPQLDANTPPRLPAVDGRNLDLVEVPENKFPPAVFAYPRSYLAGFAMSNNVTTPNTHLDVGPGACIDSTNTQNINLATSKSRNLAVLWGEGDAQDGGLDDTSTPQPGTDTWYFVFAIYDPDAMEADILFSKSMDNPTLTSENLTRFTKFRRIGAIRTDASGYIIPFKQYGDKFIWVDPPVDVTNQALSNAAGTTIKLDYVPVGWSVEALLIASVNNASTAGYAKLFDYGMTGLAPTAATGDYTIDTPGHNVYEATLGSDRACQSLVVVTDPLAQVVAWGDDPLTKIVIIVQGWIDRRGRDD